LQVRSVDWKKEIKGARQDMLGEKAPSIDADGVVEDGRDAGIAS
jgi:hypothetical protein